MSVGLHRKRKKKNPQIPQVCLSSCSSWHWLWELCNIKFYGFLSISGTILYHSIVSSFPLFLAVHPKECLLHSKVVLMPVSNWGEKRKMWMGGAVHEGGTTFTNHPVLKEMLTPFTSHLMFKEILIFMACWNHLGNSVTVFASRLYRNIHSYNCFAVLYWLIYS